MPGGAAYLAVVVERGERGRQHLLADFGRPVVEALRDVEVKQLRDLRGAVGGGELGEGEGDAAARRPRVRHPRRHLAPKVVKHRRGQLRDKGDQRRLKRQNVDSNRIHAHNVFGVKKS